MSNSIGIKIKLSASTYRALKRAAEQKRKTEAELAVDAIRVYLKPSPRATPLLGLFSGETELIDAITERAMVSRESTPLRVMR
ncbi:MAG: hypothetical protein AB1817_22535 [Chloroflexota bacterium]